jgi:hypothetical protein
MKWKVKLPEDVNVKPGLYNMQVQNVFELNGDIIVDAQLILPVDQLEKLRMHLEADERVDNVAALTVIALAVHDRLEDIDDALRNTVGGNQVKPYGR